MGIDLFNMHVGDVNLNVALAEILLALLIMVQILWGAFTNKNRHAGDFSDQQNRDYGDYWAIFSLLAVLLVVVLGDGGAQAQVGLNGLFITDPFICYGKFLILLSSCAVLLAGRAYVAFENMRRFEYPILLQCAVLGMLMMVSANDLMALYIGLELQSLSLYVLAASKGNSLHSSEAGLKYFVLGAVSSGLLLYGCSLIYGFGGGSTNFMIIAESISHYGDAVPSGFLIGLVFLICGLAFKISAVPFHMWVPDVYQGSPTSVTAFFALAPKIAAMFLFMRVLLGPFAGLVGDWQFLIILLSASSMILGAFAALVQSNIKRLMAYSSIGHIGYALMGLAAGGEQGVASVLIYLSIYLFMNLGVFILILSMRSASGVMVENIKDLSGLSRFRPGFAFGLLLCMFSMAGLPPLAGFFGKMYVFLAAVSGGLVVLAVIGALTSVVSAFYYLRLIKIAYFDEPLDVAIEPADRMGGVLMVLSALAVSFFGILLSPFVDYIGFVARALF